MNLVTAFNVRPVGAADQKMAIRYDRNYSDGFSLGFYDGFRFRLKGVGGFQCRMPGFAHGYDDGFNRGQKKARERGYESRGNQG